MSNSGVGSKNWKHGNAFPGSIKPVYGAQYPPLQEAPQVALNRNPPAIQQTKRSGSAGETPEYFEQYEASVSDAWGMEDDGVNRGAARSSAEAVLARHRLAEQQRRKGSVDDAVMVNLGANASTPSQRGKQRAMQLLATQKGGGSETSLDSSNFDEIDLNAQLNSPPYQLAKFSPILEVPEVGPFETSYCACPPLPYPINTCTLCGLIERQDANKKQETTLYWVVDGVVHFHEPLPSSTLGGVSGTTVGGAATSLYPRLPELSVSLSASTSSSSPGGGARASSSNIDKPDGGRFDRLKSMLRQDSTSTVDLDALRKDCWMGIPHKLRPIAWRLLSGYLPTNPERRKATIGRKREEYFHYVEQYFHTRHDEQHQDTFRQIHIDIPRMCPLIPLFQQKMVQEIFERILYIWAIRHPASGYVQGINDLVTPFFVVFLSEFVREDTEVGTYDVSQLPRENMEIVEADSFWCVSALLDTIQDSYTFAQPGIQRKVVQLRHLMSRVDNTLHAHMEANHVEYLQFAFRWMNNLLMREIPLRATIRLWDTYHSEKSGFADFHVYVCAAFLRMWSKQCQSQKDFQSIMIFLQNLPTQSWSDQQICELTADAFSLMCLFAGAKNHLKPNTATV